MGKTYCLHLQYFGHEGGDSMFFNNSGIYLASPHGSTSQNTNIQSNEPSGSIKTEFLDQMNIRFSKKTFHNGVWIASHQLGFELGASLIWQ
jgi:hypothetical protein